MRLMRKFKWPVKTCFHVAERIGGIGRTFPPACTVGLRLSSEHIPSRLGYLKRSLEAIATSKHLHSHQGELPAAMQVQWTEEAGVFLPGVFLSRYLCYSFLYVDQRPLQWAPFSIVRPLVLLTSFKSNWRQPWCLWCLSHDAVVLKRMASHIQRGNDDPSLSNSSMIKSVWYLLVQMVWHVGK